MAPEHAPVYVKIDEYKDIMDLVTLMREKIRQARFLLDKISELKRQEDEELSSWERDLAEVEARLSEIDKVLYQPSM